MNESKRWFVVMNKQVKTAHKREKVAVQDKDPNLPHT